MLTLKEPQNAPDTFITLKIPSQLDFGERQEDASRFYDSTTHLFGEIANSGSTQVNLINTPLFLYTGQFSWFNIQRLEIDNVSNFMLARLVTDMQNLKALIVKKLQYEGKPNSTKLIKTLWSTNRFNKPVQSIAISECVILNAWLEEVADYIMALIHIVRRLKMIQAEEPLDQMVGKRMEEYKRNNISY